MKKNVFRIKKKRRKKTSSKSNQDEKFDRFDKGNRSWHRQTFTEEKQFDAQT